MRISLIRRISLVYPVQKEKAKKLSQIIKFYLPLKTGFWYNIIPFVIDSFIENKRCLKTINATRSLFPFNLKKGDNGEIIVPSISNSSFSCGYPYRVSFCASDFWKSLTPFSLYFMAILQIRLYGDPVLLKHASPVEQITNQERQLIDDMLETMYAGNGIGLAAPQVGVLKRLIVADINPIDAANKPTVLVNPTIISQEGEALLEEGCLSFPDVSGEVKRAAKIVVEGKDQFGKEVTIDAEDLLARVIQHETEHLDGTLFIDHFSRLRRKLIRNQLRKIRANNV